MGVCSCAFFPLYSETPCDLITFSHDSPLMCFILHPDLMRLSLTKQAAASSKHIVAGFRYEIPSTPPKGKHLGDPFYGIILPNLFKFPKFICTFWHSDLYPSVMKLNRSVFFMIVSVCGWYFSYCNRIFFILLLFCFTYRNLLNYFSLQLDHLFFHYVLNSWT